MKNTFKTFFSSKRPAPPTSPSNPPQPSRGQPSTQQPLVPSYAPQAQLGFPARASSSQIYSSPIPPWQQYVNAAYYPNYRVYRNETPASLNFDHLNHIFYAFALVQEDGTVSLGDEWADTQIPVDGVHGCLASFSRLKNRHRHLRVLLSVGGGGNSQHFASVAQHPGKRQRFAVTCRELVQRFNLDGIDVDWEHPKDLHEGQNYILLLAALREELPRDYVLSSALPAGTWALELIDLAAAAEILDFINLMAYDFSGPWADACLHHAQLFAPNQNPHHKAELSGSLAVEYVKMRGVPPSKVLLGIPAYGRSFLECDGPGHVFNKTAIAGDEGTWEYKHLPRPGMQEFYDPHHGTAWCTGSYTPVGEADAVLQGKLEYVTYDNPQTVTVKARYAQDQGLGGVFFWTATADTNDPRRSLISASFKALHFR